MPNFGSGDVGLGIAKLDNPEATQALMKYHRNREKDRMQIPDIPDPILRTSEEQAVYIYNVSTQRFPIELGSYGARVIHALPEEECLKETDDLKYKVAGPLIVPGLPYEHYPAEGEAKTIYHRPRKVVDPGTGKLTKGSLSPGWDFALQIVGAGLMMNPASDIRPFGVFISEFPEQHRPEKITLEKEIGETADELKLRVKAAEEGAWKRYKKWIEMVKQAKDTLRATLAKKCQEANLEYSRGKFADVRSDALYQYARLIHGTEAQYPWLKDTGDKAEKTTCEGCGTTIKIGIIKCPTCRMIQVSADEWEKVKARYQ